MRKVNARSIELYSRCPKKAEYLWGTNFTEVPQVQTVVSNVIKSAYLYTIRKGKFPPFRRLTKWTEQFMLQQLIAGDYKQSKQLLTIVSNWYNKLYLEKYYDEGVINLPVSLDLGTQLTYFDTIDIVTLGNSTQLFGFTEVRDTAQFRAYNGIKIYNDLVAQSHIWSFWKASGVMPDYYVRLVIGPRTIRDVRIKVTRKLLDRTEKYIRQITRGMQDRAFYPSFSEQCVQCPFVAKCSI